MSSQWTRKESTTRPRRANVHQPATEWSDVAFEKNGYTLYARQQPTRGNQEQTIYFFSKRRPVVGRPLDEIPEGYIVSVDRKSGVPYLNKR